MSEGVPSEPQKDNLSQQDRLLPATYQDLFRNCVRLASRGEPLQAQSMLEFTTAMKDGIILPTHMVGRSISGKVGSRDRRKIYLSIDALTSSYDAQVAENMGAPGQVVVNKEEGDKYEAMVYISFMNEDPQREHDSEVSRHLAFNNNAIRIYTHESLETPEEDPVIASLCGEWGLSAMDPGQKEPYVRNKEGILLLNKLGSLRPEDFISFTSEEEE
jgi:hypothetical protein